MSQTETEIAEDITPVILEPLPDGFEYWFEPIVFKKELRYKVSVHRTPLLKKWAYEIFGGGIVSIVGALFLFLKFGTAIKERYIKSKGGNGV